MNRRKKSKAGRGNPGAQVPPGSRRPRMALALVAVVIVVAVVAGALLFANRSGGDGAATAGTAVIVDQVSLTEPNPEFVSSARDLLAQGGYPAAYFPSEQVTVDFYRTLPQRGYDVILLRIHSGITTEVDAATGERTGTEYVSLFTGEPFSEGKYGQEELDRLGRAVYYEGADPLFGIGPAFIQESMQGTFDDAIIVMMGCDGLRSQRTAQAFLDKGASAFISWDKLVSGSHSDAATERLLELLLVDGLTATDAVAQTAAELGPDPVFEAELRILTPEG